MNEDFNKGGGPPITPPPEDYDPRHEQPSNQWVFVGTVPLENYRISENNVLIENKVKLTQGDIVTYLSISNVNYLDPNSQKMTSSIMISLRLGNDDEILIHYDGFNENNFRQD